MNTSRLGLLGAIAALALALPVFAYADVGNLLQMTTITRMSGSPMGNMPPRTRSDKVCVSARKPDPRDFNKNRYCKVSDIRQSGDSTSYHMECTMPGGMQTRGDGKFQIRGDGGIHGSIHVVSHGSMNMTMDMNYDGTRIGACDYKPSRTATH